jgi:Protein of unknown function (DUF3592)
MQAAPGRPEFSVASVFGGTGMVVTEAGLAVVSLLIAALPLVLLIATRRNVALSLRGRRAPGRITRMERTGRRVWHGCVRFRAADGREITFRERMSGHLHVGAVVTVHYDPDHPDRATRRPARGVAALVLFLIILSAVGLCGLAGTVYTAAAGGFGTFLNWYGIPLFLIFAGVFLAGAWRYLSEVSRWKQRAAAVGLVTRIDTTTASNELAARGSYPWVSFVAADGRKLEFRESIGTPAPVGSRVTVYYDPGFPEETATIVGPGRTARLAVAMTLGGLLWLVLAAGFAWGQFSGQR